MGNYLARKRVASAELEELAKEIQRTENHINGLTRRQAFWQRLFSYFAFVISTAIAAVFYSDMPLYGYWIIIYLALPLILTYLLHSFGKRPIGHYYTWRIDRGRAALDVLIEKKQNILDNVRQTETYNVAKELLEKYGGSEMEPLPEEPHNTPKAVQSKGDVFDETSLNLSLLNKTRTPDNEDVHDVTMTAAGEDVSMCSTVTPCQSPPYRRPRTTRPFYPESKTSVDKILDYMCGDGITKRYALICQRCYTHNGMAHIDEADNIAYRCYKCDLFHQAKSAGSRTSLSD
uniref:Endoplasmic reticulum junction formation protein lunapark n=1 Tax=Steinernema glaseri TaxID=37863 RepID=A0A1I7ZAR8_9BILA